jgi:hypothetical protein
MSWNQENLTAIVSADNSIFAVTALNTTNAKIFFNQSMSTLFDSFAYIYPNVIRSSPQYSFLVMDTQSGAGLFIVSTYSVTGIITPVYTAIQVIQDHQTASLMNPVQSIVFSTSLLPIVPENIGQPRIMNGLASNNQTITGSAAQLFPAITDFSIPFTALNNYVPDISYVPSGEYRLVDMYGESPINQIDVDVFWKDIYGILHPFLLSSGCSGSIKMMFRSKKFGNIV